MRVVAIAVLVLAATGCGGSRAANACPGARLAAAQGTAVSEATGQHTLLVDIVDRGAACTIEGVPGIELLDAHGKTLAFSYTHAGDQMIAPARPEPIRLAPGRPGLVELNKYRCDIRSTAFARSIRLELPQLPALRLNLERQPVLDWCPGEKPSSVVDVSALLAAPPAISADGRGVLQDLYDGHLDRRWTCGSLRAAFARLPADGPTYSRIPGVIAGASARECASALAAIRPGTERTIVSQELGAPGRAGPRCAIWRWPTTRAERLDGAQICFRSGRVTAVKTAVHG